MKNGNLRTWLIEGNGKNFSGGKEGIRVWKQSERRNITGSDELSLFFKGV